LRINFYRIVQEAINDIMKHLDASEVEIKVEKNGDEISLPIRDNGRGLSSDQNDGMGKGVSA